MAERWHLRPRILRNQRFVLGIGLIVVVFNGRWVLFFFDGFDFPNPAEVSSAGEIGAEPDLDHFAKQDFAQKLA
jgi:hypothetical protein